MIHRFVPLLVLVVTIAAATLAASACPVEAVEAVDHDGYTPPVAAPVIDPFRPPGRFAGPGNRGLEYRTRPGQVVSASGAGRVAFAGPVASRLVVAVDHPDGLRTTYTGLTHIVVSKGQSISRGQHLGVAGDRLHFGVRAGSAYLDPAVLFAASRREVRLVPVAWLVSP